jgi:hypothetical protein
MTPNDLLILETCGIIAVALWLIGCSTLVVAAKKARTEYRVKGYLRAPSGLRWFRFLIYKQYNSFDNPSTRFFFSITHFCMMALFVVLVAVIALLGSEALLKGVNGLPSGGWIK